MTVVIVWGIIVVQSLFVVALFAIVVQLGLIVFGFKQVLPYVPSTRGVMRSVIASGVFADTEAIIDLGCGTGTMLAALHRAYPEKRFVGIEYKRWLVWLCRARFAFTKNPPVILYGDMFEQDVSEFDGVIGFWITDFLPRLAEKFAAESRPGTIIVSNVFQLPSHPHLKEAVLPHRKHDTLYSYTIM